MILPLTRAGARNLNYRNQSQTKVSRPQISQASLSGSQLSKTLTHTFPSTTVSTLSTTVLCTTGNPQQNRLIPALVAFVCISVLLLIIIIILVFKWRSDKKRIPTSIRSQESSGSRTDYNHGYVEPNNLTQGRIAGAVGRSSLIRENKFCENCRRIISENGKPGIDNEAHDYIYLQDNTFRQTLPDPGMKTSSSERIPEIIYSDSKEPYTPSSTSNKDNAIYHVIDTAAASDPKDKPDERTGNPDPSSTNLYHVVELDYVAEKANS